MREIKSEPVLTDTYETPAGFMPQRSSVYFYGDSDEERSKHIKSWVDSVESVSFRHVIGETPTTFFLEQGGEYFLRSQKSLVDLWTGVDPAAKIYIDITGLTHSVWAAVLRSAINAGFEVLVVYVEPKAYSRSGAPVEGQVYDLSERISGISPLPGFAVLSQRSSGEFVFVPLLGFEGTRLRHIIEQIQPGHDRIIPVIGLPGFKPWYVFETFKGNKGALLETDAWQSVRYAPGDCPFSCYYLLDDIAERSRDSNIKIAPIGTKPHALGAVMFSINRPSRVEIVYDHPVRKSGRTDGTSKLHVYHVSAVLKSEGREDALAEIMARRAGKSK